jgi:hypothetical protein
MSEWRVKARAFGERWKFLKPAREDWLEESSGVFVVLLNVLAFVLWGGWVPVMGLALMALAVLHLRMLDRRMHRDTSKLLDETLNMLKADVAAKYGDLATLKALRLARSMIPMDPTLKHTRVN